jgi:thymidylate kinase
VLIILEGCDGTGKSTIAKNLANILDARIIHCTKETPNDFDFFREIIINAQDTNIIADRFCYGQFVYQNIEERNLSEFELEVLECLMLRGNVKLIHVKAPIDVIEKRLAERNEITELKVKYIVEKFNLIFRSSLLPLNVWWTGDERRIKKCRYLV